MRALSIFPYMLARSLLVALALAAPAALGADRVWVIDEAMVSVEHGPQKGRLSAVSIDLQGVLREKDPGLVARLTLPASSFRTGDAARDLALRALAGDVVIDVSAPATEGATRLRGTLTFHGVTRPIDVSVALTRGGGQIWAHAVLNLKLRDFGAELPDEPLCIDVDAGFRRPGTAVASR